jgi:hypothetical protein
MIEDISEDDFLDSIDEDDFVFVLDCEGNLKTFIFPDEFDNSTIPKNILDILNIFGVNNVESTTVH